MLVLGLNETIHWVAMVHNMHTIYCYVLRGEDRHAMRRTKTFEIEVTEKREAKKHGGSGLK